MDNIPDGVQNALANVPGAGYRSMLFRPFPQEPITTFTAYIYTYGLSQRYDYHVELINDVWRVTRLHNRHGT